MMTEDYMTERECSEKPPHHMGIKTNRAMELFQLSFSEKPPHHMGIKTEQLVNFFRCVRHSEKPPHHMGIKTC